MKQLATGKVRFVLTEEPAMGILSWLFYSKSEEPRWMRRWVLPLARRDDVGIDRIEKDTELDEIKRAAAADTDAIEEEGRTYFRRDGPGDREDDL